MNLLLPVIYINRDHIWIVSYFFFLNSFWILKLIFFPYSEQLRCSYTRPTEDQYLIYGDKVTNAYSEQTCKQSCSQESEFNCRSYSFRKDVSHANLPHFDFFLLNSFLKLVFYNHDYYLRVYWYYFRIDLEVNVY